MSKTLNLNPDSDYVRKLLEAVEYNENHCPCQVIKEIGSQCPFSFDYLPNQVSSNLLCGNGSAISKCHCKLYI